MIDIDCDDHDIDHAMRRATRIRWVNSRTVPYVAHRADDCAPELETQPTAGLHVVVSVDPWGRIVHELREGECPLSDTLLWKEIPTVIGALGRGGLAMRSAPRPDQMAAWMGWYDVDRDRPSPGDDITRAAFDAMDGQS